MDSTSAVPEYTPKPETRDRDRIDPRYTWKLADIFANWDEWETAYSKLEKRIEELAAFRGTLHEGAEKLLAFLKLNDTTGIESYKVWYYPALTFDQDQRRNEIDARRQRVQELFSRFGTATSWYGPEVLALGRETVRAWMDENEELALYRFSLEELFRQQEHVLDEGGEKILALAGRFSSTPSSTYSMLSTADATFPEVTLSTGETVTVSPGAYGSLLHTSRVQEDREKVFRAHYGTYEANVNTYSSIYNQVLQRGWFFAQSRGYKTVLEAKLHGNNIPPAVVETLIGTAKAGNGPLRRYHQLRKQVLGLETYHLFDGFAPLVDLDPKYGYDQVRDLILTSVQPLGEAYAVRMREAFEGRWIDVYENEGKRSGAYSASVYDVHPYMLLNYQDTLDDVFTLAHELGHTMHSILSNENQPFVYSDYTIFVAEVASTFNEALLLETMLARSNDPRERAMLLQHSIDGIVGTFYTQALFADYELQAHRLVEAGQPITADALNELYFGLLHDYYGDSVDLDDLYKVTWARIPHFYHSPYYVYQYATCFASSATILRAVRSGEPDAVDRYLTLLKSGGSDHPMDLLKRAGADLSRTETVQAVVDQLDALVGKLATELKALGYEVA